MLLAKDHDHEQDPRFWVDGIEYSGIKFTPRPSADNPATFIYPETARWCLCALKNLTRPCKDGGAAVRELIHTGIVPFLLRNVAVNLLDGEEDDMATRRMRQRQLHRDQKRRQREQRGRDTAGTTTTRPEEMRHRNSGNDSSASSSGTPEPMDPSHS